MFLNKPLCYAERLAVKIIQSQQLLLLLVVNRNRSSHPSLFAPSSKYSDFALSVGCSSFPKKLDGVSFFGNPDLWWRNLRCRQTKLCMHFLTQRQPLLLLLVVNHNHRLHQVPACTERSRGGWALKCQHHFQRILTILHFRVLLNCLHIWAEL